MVIDSKSVWVFDLDDTLYNEIDYQSSGYKAIVEHIKLLYGIDTTDVINTARAEKRDVLDTLCQYLKLPLNVKESLLWIYRLHFPEINLAIETREIISLLNEISNGVFILTDGRAISQRNKIKALGLSELPCYISEEWGEVKPGEKRYKAIMEKNQDNEKFIYVADNVSKDFITPKKLGWKTIGLIDNGKNIHKNNISLDKEYYPDFWIENIKEIKKIIV